MRRGILAAALLWLLLLLTGCSGPFLFGPAMGDWIFDGLPGGYEVWRVNSKSVTLQRRQADGMGRREILGSYLLQIAYTEDYIFAQQTDPPEEGGQCADGSDPEYFIVGVEAETVAGPYTEGEFEREYAALGLAEGPDWLGLADLAQQASGEGVS